MGNTLRLELITGWTSVIFCIVALFTAVPVMASETAFKTADGYSGHVFLNESGVEKAKLTFYEGEASEVLAIPGTITVEDRDYEVVQLEGFSIPDEAKANAVKKIIVPNSVDLSNFWNALGNFNNLNTLEAKNNVSLKEFPYLGQFMALKKVDLEGCTNLTTLTNVSSVNLDEINIQGTGVTNKTRLLTVFGGFDPMTITSESGGVEEYKVMDGLLENPQSTVSMTIKDPQIMSTETKTQEGKTSFVFKGLSLGDTSGSVTYKDAVVDMFLVVKGETVNVDGFTGEITPNGDGTNRIIITQYTPQGDSTEVHIPAKLDGYPVSLKNGSIIPYNVSKLIIDEGVTTENHAIMMITSEQLSEISIPSTITCDLSLWNTQIHDLSGLQNATGLTGLSVYTMSMNSEFAPLDLTYIENLVGLRNLELNRVRISHLEKLKALTDLEILTINADSSELNNTIDLAPLASMKNLKTVQIGNTMRGSSESASLINFESIKELANLKSLRLWNIKGGVDENAKKTLGQLGALKSLSLNNLAGVDVMDLVIDLDHLESLNLSGAPITNLSGLSTKNTIRNLNLSDCKNLTNESLAPLAQMESLYGITLGGTSITSLDALKGSKSLRYLDINGLMDFSNENKLDFVTPEKVYLNVGETFTYPEVKGVINFYQAENVQIDFSDTGAVAQTNAPSLLTMQKVYAAENSNIVGAVKEITTIKNNKGEDVQEYQYSLTAMGLGSTIAKVSTQEGEKSFEIIVNKPATDIALNKETLALNIGKSEKLIPTITPADASNQNIKWSSSDEKIATVSDGAVTGVAEGIATITVTTEDGGKTASCKVTVSAAGTTIDDKTPVKNTETTSGGNDKTSVKNTETASESNVKTGLTAYGSPFGVVLTLVFTTCILWVIWKKGFSQSH